ncbi:hypothetical protein [Adhaeribacter aerolatus]|uniref:hypothetical protein n=1 Tax=Adhaeribacter aerolatus TaxID=670289 RepID=UPI0011BD8757|nr:hypothetical protein [Adhaeribacter aerolatus]
MKKLLLFLVLTFALFTRCQTAEPNYFMNDDLIVEKVLVSTSTDNLSPSCRKSFLLRRVKDPNMVAVLHEDGLRIRTSRISYRVGDTVRVSLIDKSLFAYSGR